MMTNLHFAVVAFAPSGVSAPGGASLMRVAAPRHLRCEAARKTRPILHQPPAFLEQVAAPVCCLNTIAGRVRECLFDDVVWLSSPAAQPRNALRKPCATS
jgi:hypothetical protein